MSLAYLIMAFSLLNLISPKLNIYLKLRDDEVNVFNNAEEILNDGEEKKICNLEKIDFILDDSYEFIGKLKSSSKVYFKIKISKEECSDDISLSYCGSEDLSDSSFIKCFSSLSTVFLKKKEEEKYNIFSGSFSLKKDYDYIDFLIEVPPDVDLNCVIIKFYSEGDDENSVLIIIVVSIIFIILVGVGIVYYKNYIKNKELQKDYEQIKEEIHENKENKKIIKEKD